MDTTRHTMNLKQFPTLLYQSINNRAGTLVNLLEAMCSVANAKSVVEYSLAACYQRSYSTLFKAIDELKVEQIEMLLAASFDATMSIWTTC